VAWDIETSGLNWSQDAIGTCQVATEEWAAVIVRPDEDDPKYLRALLEHTGVQKVFHHAMFDLRFMASHWGAQPRNIACTKVASKILNPELEAGMHSLKPVLARHLNIEISKTEQVSDWLAPLLTRSQLEYAISDVRHLIPLHRVLESKCWNAQVHEELLASFQYLPTRVSLDLRGSGDVFKY
jgi:ribonuclease D